MAFAFLTTFVGMIVIWMPLSAYRAAKRGEGNPSLKIVAIHLSIMVIIWIGAMWGIAFAAEGGRALLHSN
jgi:hypothetical protein